MVRNLLLKNCPFVLLVLLGCPLLFATPETIYSSSALTSLFCVIHVVFIELIIDAEEGVLSFLGNNLFYCSAQDFFSPRFNIRNQMQTLHNGVLHQK